jgi:GT2 family glycosyltransferase
LESCLKSIFKSVRGLSVEVFVVDNASTDGSREMVSAKFHEVHLLRNSKREGYGFSHNLAIRKARGTYVLILNEDMEVLGHAIHVLLERARGIEGLGVLGCRILNANRSLQHSCFRFPTLTSTLFEMAVPYTLALGNSRLRSKMYYWAHDKQLDVDIVLGCCMLMPMTVLEKAGLFEDWETPPSSPPAPGAATG